MNKKTNVDLTAVFIAGALIGIFGTMVVYNLFIMNDKEVIPLCEEGQKRCNPEQNGIIQLCEDNEWIDTEDKSDFCIPTDCGDTDFKQIIFAHSLSCPHCRNMMPIIEELEAEGYEFYWAEGGSISGKSVHDCYSEVMTGYVPQFICSSNKETIGGAMPKENLVAWINEKCGG
ncbi:hypothetical protein KY343_05775 [Candidatus Woesearchaeota archaeon]|nr:hypothetical protein [Candidatus Woesearchaeota archaeon]